jgi:ATP-binding cassette subfamily F protein uup
VFEGGGRVVEYVGGYEDWLRQRAATSSPAEPAPVRADADRPRPPADPSRRKLSYNERREFDALPDRIRDLEQEDARVRAAIAAPEFYKAGKTEIDRALARLESLRVELDAIYARWDELDSRAR